MSYTTGILWSSLIGGVPKESGFGDLDFVKQSITYFENYLTYQTKLAQSKTEADAWLLTQSLVHPVVSELQQRLNVELLNSGDDMDYGLQTDPIYYKVGSLERYGSHPYPIPPVEITPADISNMSSVCSACMSDTSGLISDSSSSDSSTSNQIPKCSAFVCGAGGQPNQRVNGAQQTLICVQDSAQTAANEAIIQHQNEYNTSGETLGDVCNIGFVIYGGTPATGQYACPEDKKKVSISGARCASSPCVEATDKDTCCITDEDYDKVANMVCASGFVNNNSSVDTSVLTQLQKCPNSRPIVSSSAKCAGKVCKASDEDTCCPEPTKSQTSTSSSSDSGTCPAISQATAYKCGEDTTGVANKVYEYLFAPEIRNNEGLPSFPTDCVMWDPAATSADNTAGVTFSESPTCLRKLDDAKAQILARTSLQNTRKWLRTEEETIFVYLWTAILQDHIDNMSENADYKNSGFLYWYRTGLESPASQYRSSSNYNKEVDSTLVETGGAYTDAAMMASFQKKEQVEPDGANVPGETEDEYWMPHLPQRSGALGTFGTYFWIIRKMLPFEWPGAMADTISHAGAGGKPRLKGNEFEVLLGNFYVESCFFWNDPARVMKLTYSYSASTLMPPVLRTLNAGTLARGTSAAPSQRVKQMTLYYPAPSMPANNIETSTAPLARETFFQNLPGYYDLRVNFCKMFT